MSIPRNDPFPAADFDKWAESYDRTIHTSSVYPFGGYQQVLETILQQANPRSGQTVLDLGTGTGNLALLFAQHNCHLTCTDFSAAMLAQARVKLPQAVFALHDLRQKFPSELNQRFDYIVSAYVFHHFELDQKVHICTNLIKNHLLPGGSLLIGDLSFADLQAQETFRRDIPDWDEEFYWLADDALEALEKSGLAATYIQVTPCAGVYHLQDGETGFS